MMSRAQPPGTSPFHPAAPPWPAWTAAVNARWLIPMTATRALSYWPNAQSDWPGAALVSNWAAALGLVLASWRSWRSSRS